MKPVKLVNVFEIKGMPADVPGQEEVVNKLFGITTVHVHGEDGRYFLVRITQLNQTVAGVQARKLDPDARQDMEEIAHLVELIHAQGVVKK